jgi:hypothetical protein
MKQSILSACVCVRMHVGKCVRHAGKCLCLKFFVNSQHKWFGQSKRKGEKKFGLIPLLMKVTIPDTHGTKVKSKSFYTRAIIVLQNSSSIHLSCLIIQRRREKRETNFKFHLIALTYALLWVS